MSVYLGCDETFFIAYTCYAPGTLPLDARFTACIGFLYCKTFMILGVLLLLFWRVQISYKGFFYRLSVFLSIFFFLTM